MIRKTLSYEAQGNDRGSRWTALLVADDDKYGFAEETQAFSRAVGRQSGRSSVGIQDDGKNARTALLAGFNDGTGLIEYFGMAA